VAANHSQCVPNCGFAQKPGFGSGEILGRPTTPPLRPAAQLRGKPRAGDFPFVQETLTISAVSFTLSPPKKRSSTIRDFRGSTSPAHSMRRPAQPVPGLWLAPRPAAWRDPAARLPHRACRRPCAGPGRAEFYLRGDISENSATEFVQALIEGIHEKDVNLIFTRKVRGKRLGMQGKFKEGTD
jgi:hypothetical protein